MGRFFETKCNICTIAIPSLWLNDICLSFNIDTFHCRMGEFFYIPIVVLSSGFVIFWSISLVNFTEYFLRINIS